MKNLVAKAGVAAVTSVLLTSVISVPEVQALELSPSTQATLRNGSLSGNPADPSEVDYLEISSDNGFDQEGIVEAGEIPFNETRGYVEYDLSSFTPQEVVDNTFSVSFSVFGEGGSGSGGFTGIASNLGNPFKGIVDVVWYRIDPTGTPLDDTNPLFNPPREGGSSTPGDPDPFGFGSTPYTNPLTSIDMNGKQDGDRISLDVSGLVKDLFLLSGEQGFGLMFKANIDSPGQCGDSEANVCEGVMFNDFGIEAVPTPAAILPSLFGLASAAFRKKQKDEDGLNSEEV